MGLDSRCFRLIIIRFLVRNQLRNEGLQQFIAVIHMRKVSVAHTLVQFELFLAVLKKLVVALQFHLVVLKQAVIQVLIICIFLKFREVESYRNN